MQTRTSASRGESPDALPATTHHRPDDPPRVVTALLVFSLIWLAPVLACGSFQPRPTPSPTPGITPMPADAISAAAPAATDTPAILIQPTPTPPPEPTPTFTPTPLPGTALVVGEPARVVAPGGLNLRETPSTGGTLVTRLGVGQRVSVSEGPVSADGYVWWRVDDGQGNAGWAAQGEGADVWLSPQIGEAQPVNRAPRVGDRVRVTMEPNQQLTIRTMPGTSAAQVTRASSGQEFTVLAGPQSANGFIWYQIRSDDGGTTGWAADGNDTQRWLSPLE